MALFSRHSKCDLIIFMSIGTLIGCVFFVIILNLFPSLNTIILLNLYDNSNKINESEKSDNRISFHKDNNDVEIKMFESVSENDVVSDTNFGKIRGLKIRDFGIVINQFLGIPFAVPPIKKRRFKRSYLWKKQWTGVRDAIEWPPSCVQPNLVELREFMKLYHNNFSEDCLFLNIWTPQNYSNSLRDSLMPVMVFIHGGSFLFGGTSTDLYNGRTISALGNIIVVTVQYRLGVFGFLNAETNSAPGNVGLSDQITALQWIKHNIHHFGGDPNAITLFGQSAGAISIGFLMMSEGKELFQRAILESGSPMLFNAIFKSGKKVFENFTKTIACDNTDPEEAIECLKELPAERLNEMQLNVDVEIDLMLFMPNIPSDLLPQYPNEFFYDPKVNQKDILMGVNAHEGTIFLYGANRKLYPIDSVPNITTIEVARNALIKMIDGVNEISASQKQTLSLIALPDLSYSDSLNITHQTAAVIGDLIFACPCLKLADNLIQADVNVYLYYFTQKSPQSIMSEWIGVTHHDEIPFVFGLPLRFPNLYDGEEIELSKRIIKTWSHFAKTGKMLSQMDIQWPQNSIDNYSHMELNAKYSKIGNNLNADCVLYKMANDMIL